MIYSFVARDNAVLAEYTGYTGNFNTIALECLQNTDNGEQKFTITCDKYTFNFLKSNGYTFLCVADETYGREIPYACLQRIADEFMPKYGEKAKGLAAHSLDKVFGPRLKEHLEYCTTHAEEISKTAAVLKQVNDVKGIMVENIEKVLARGEKIEVLVEKTDDLRVQAQRFQKEGRNLRNKFWWQNLRMKIVLALVVVLLAVIIFVLVCFSGGNSCIKKNN